MLRKPSFTRRRGPARCAFTLVEVLIVVVIISVVAGVVITHYNDSSTDAKESVLEHNLHILRSQTELYAINHQGEYPELIRNGLPQLTGATDALGNLGTSGPRYPYGPYVDVIPANPFNDDSKVVAVAKPGQTPTAPSGNTGGWQYDETTGGIWPNHPEYFRGSGAPASFEAEPVERAEGD